MNKSIIIKGVINIVLKPIYKKNLQKYQ